MTTYAKLIMDMVNESREHLTAEQIFLKLKKARPKVVLATVYNNLNMLCSEGLIRKLTMESSPDRYDRMQKHDHVVCCRCGKLADFSFPDLTEDLERQLGEKITGYDLKVWHLCPECRGKKQEGDRNESFVNGCSCAD